jgi:PAS domain S-box-containing protein
MRAVDEAIVPERYDAAEWFRLLVDSVREYAIFLLDSRGHVATWNRGAERIKGYDADEIIGRHVSVFYTPEDVAAGMPTEAMESAIRDGAFRNEGWRIRKDGSRFWADVTLTALFDSQGRHRGFAKVTRDMTERQLAQQAIRELNAELERRVERRTAELAAAVRVRDEFLSIASHELKTPVTALDLQVQALRQRLRASASGVLAADDLMPKLANLERQSARLNNLINTLLDVTRITTGRMIITREPVDLLEVTREVVHRSQEIIERAGSVVTLDSDDGAVVGSWDRLRIDNVVTNLLSNAVKYGEGKPIDIAIDKKGGTARLRMTDHGIGIPADRRKRIFERFERGVDEEHYGGFGIGLWVVQQIVEAHAGKVEVMSRERAGSTFIVELPLVGGDE